MATLFLSNKAIMSKTADEWRAEAKEQCRSSYESFERCDTDGFLSQHASREFAYGYEMAARIVEDGGLHTFEQLYDLDGNPVRARLVRTKYGWSYAIDTEDGTEWFNPSKAANEETRIKNDAKKGYFVGKADKPAAIFYADNMYGTKYIGEDRYADIDPVYHTNKAK